MIWLPATLLAALFQAWRTAVQQRVRAELSVPHTLLMFLPGLASTETRSITISRTYFYRQRVGDNIACSDC